MQITAKQVVPIPSATVVLVRDALNGPEVFLALRKKNAAFGASYVFPGGGIDPVDKNFESNISDKENRIINDYLNLKTGGYEYFSAAIRELFEEAGILLVLNDKKQFPEHLNLKQYRDLIYSKALCWNDFLKDNSLHLDHKKLIYFSYWVTPLYLSRRYTTRFFITEIPVKQEASHCGKELIDSCWITAKEALIARRKKEINIPYPTAITLMQIRRFDCVNEILEWAKNRSILGVPCYFPELTETERQEI